VLQDAPQTCLYSLDDMHIPIPKIEEVMKFQKELTDKKTLEKFQSGGFDIV
jgi:hypothetical protein